ncbi:MoxR-like ATPase [Methanomicrobium sp. W14]|uniref:AAA family ATPase n=1 Tax=Methanomicrobium sp. W14 TaxID=2817839 RepID=UPI001AE415D6|nr:MoxR family ATPase [Methanomicrobium sp. W14]MBP2132784.1 MoxR-like ATPase [Methanomicrobium sp. W14]
MDNDIEFLNGKAKEYSHDLDNVKNEVQKVIVGQDDVVKRLLVAICAEGNVLLEGVPGIAKTLLIKTLSECVGCTFSRIQFTPDLLPADITGTKIYNHNDSVFTTLKGPIFNSFVLADEINRAPPKVQSALLEAMQEKQVTIQGDTYQLDKPFFILATENPIESEGTYPLPEAQTDRFMFKVMMTYPSIEDEVKILDRFTDQADMSPSVVISSEKILEIQSFIKSVYAESEVKNYAARIVDATRNPEKYGIEAGRYISYGASPRASIYLILGAKGYALLSGRGYVVPDDIKQVAHDVLRHRIIRTYEAEADEVSTDTIIDSVLHSVEIP